MIFSMQKPLAAHNWPGVTSRCSYPVNTPSTSVAKESQNLVQCVIILFFRSVSLSTAIVLLQILLHDPLCDFAQLPPKVSPCPLLPLIYPSKSWVLPSAHKSARSPDLLKATGTPRSW